MSHSDFHPDLLRNKMLMEEEYFRFLITRAPHLRKVDGIPKSLIDRGTASGHILVSDEGGLAVTSEGAAWVAEYLAQWGKVCRDNEVDMIVQDHHGEIFDCIKAGGCLSELAKAFDCPGLALSEADIREGLARWEEEKQAECRGFYENLVIGRVNAV